MNKVKGTRGAVRDPLAVKLSTEVFDSLMKVTALLTERDRYNIRATVDLAKRNGEHVAADWIRGHPEQYGAGIWHGFYVGEE